MLTLFKWFAGLILSLLLLVLIGIVLLPQWLDQQVVKSTIISLVKERTGRTLSMEGDLTISVVPWVGFAAERLTLTQPSNFGIETEPMITVGSAQLRVKLLPLLSRRVEVDTVVLQQPRLRLISLADGRNSFEGLLAPETSPPSAGETPSEASPVAILVQGLRISDADALWQDQRSGASYRLQNFNFESGNLLDSEPQPVQMSGRAIDASDPTPIQFEIDGAARIDATKLALEGRNWTVNIGQTSQATKLVIDELMIEPQGRSRAKGLRISADISGLDEQGLAAHIEGTLSALTYDGDNSQIDLEQVEGNVKFNAPNQPANQIRFDLPSLVYSLETQQATAKKLALDGEYQQRKFKFEGTTLELDQKGQRLALAAADIKSMDLEAQLLKPIVRSLFDQPELSAGLQTQRFDANALLKDLKIDYRPTDSTALRQVAVRGQLIASAERFALADMTLQLDQSEVLGSIALGLASPSSAEFKLRVDTVALDRYMPLAETNSSTGPASGAEALAVPMALFQDMRANGELKIGQLRTGGLQFDAVDVRVTSVGGVVTIRPNAKLYEGSLAGNMVFEQRGKESILRVKNEIDLVSLAPFLKAADITDQLSGIGSLVLDLTITEIDGKQSNRGTIKLQARNGVVRGVDLKQIVDNGYARYRSLRGKPLEEKQASGQASDETKFAEMLGSFDISDFKLSSREFSLKAPLFRVTGGGDIDIARQSLDYLLQVSIVNSSSGQGGEALEQLKGLTLPIRLRGALSAPSYSIDMQAMAKGLLGNEFEQQKAKLLEKKLGIEQGGKLSTGEILQQVIKRKIDRKTGQGNSSPDEVITIEPPTEANKSEAGASDIPAKTPANRVPDVPANPADEQQPDASKAQPRSTKDQLKEQLLKEILKSGG